METAKNVTLLAIATTFSGVGGGMLANGEIKWGCALLGASVLVLIVRGILQKYGIDAGAKRKK